MTIEEMKERGLLLFECISGSRAYGLNTPTSDTDIRGVFYLPKEQFYGMEYIPQISNDTNDIVYYELGRFIELLSKNNPNILELLATPEEFVLYKHPLIDKVKLEDFLSKLSKDAFAGYAMSQIKKAKGLNKKVFNPIDKDRKELLDFCYVLEGEQTINLKEWLSLSAKKQERCGLVKMSHSKDLYALFYDEVGDKRYKGIVRFDESNQVSVSSVPKGENAIAYLLCKIDEYSTHCKLHREYWDWIEKRNEVRYQNTLSHDGGYDSKNMMHTIRLMLVARDIFRDNQVIVFTPYKEELFKIKAGDYSYEELLTKVQELNEEVEELYSNSVLPERPDLNKVGNLLVEMRVVLYG
ncbi:MAG: nucleotidyltransferase domain-containing protein [Myroides sp.]|jgi:hypothetical protein|nr:nucleotidyltransferase domain-containing protein [Myroides sp.]